MNPPLGSLSPAPEFFAAFSTTDRDHIALSGVRIAILVIVILTP
jgi:hypothetical protein